MALATNVFCARNGFKMIWIYAGWVAAEVINLETGRDGGFEKPVREPVSRDELALDAEVAVAVTILRADPKPATAVGLRKSEPVKAIFERLLNGGHLVFPPDLMGTKLP